MSLTVYTAIPNSDVDPESPITTSLVTNLRNNPIAMVHQYVGAPHLMYQYDPVLSNHGAEGDSSITISASQNTDRAIYECTNFTLDASQTLTSLYSALIIRATGTITINGDINCRGSDITNYLPHSSDMFMGGAGGGGGGGGSGGGSTEGADLGVRGGNGGFVLGGAGGGRNSNGSAPSALSSQDQTDQQRIMGLLTFGGGPGGDSGAGGGGDDGSGPSGSAGGVPGGSVMLIAPTIVVGAGSTIRVDGANGANGTNTASNAGGSGGGGGGGGGSIYLIGHSITNNGSSSVTGGTGGTGGTSGGTGSAGGDGGGGGDGYTKEITLTE